MDNAPIPYEQRVNNPDFPFIGFRVPRSTAERFWRMSKARNEWPYDTFVAAINTLAEKMNSERG